MALTDKKGGTHRQVALTDKVAVTDNKGGTDRQAALRDKKGGTDRKVALTDKVAVTDKKGDTDRQVALTDKSAEWHSQTSLRNGAHRQVCRMALSDKSAEWLSQTSLQIGIETILRKGIETQEAMIGKSFKYQFFAISQISRTLQKSIPLIPFFFAENRENSSQMLRKVY